MDKLVIDLPDWAKVSNIYVFAGLELMAIKHPGIELKMKTSRCTKCGECCRSIKGDYPAHINGVCVYLKNDLCSLGMLRPFSCGLPQTKFECDERFK